MSTQGTWPAGVAQQRSVWQHPRWHTPAAVYLGDRGNNSNSVSPASHSKTPSQNKDTTTVSLW